MKKILIVFFFFFPGFVFAYYGYNYQYNQQPMKCCTRDRWTGNIYCHTTLASRYKKPNINYSSRIDYRDTSDFYRVNQICPRNSHFERYPINACVCNQGYTSSPDKIACLKKPKVLSNEATRILMKALSKQPLTIQEKSYKTEIMSWLNDWFNQTR